MIETDNCNKNYEVPKLYTMSAFVEQGFALSSTLDDMYETEGEWY